MYNDYAAVIPEETVSTLSDGRIQGRVAVCIVRDAVAEAHVVWPTEGERLVGTLPRVPSAPGHSAALLDFEEEMEVLQTIEEAIRAETVRLTYGAPPSFMEAGSVLTAGLLLMFQEVGVDVRISPLLAGRLRWKEGDQIRFATSVDGSIGSIYCEESGTSLIPSEAEAGHLEVSSYLAFPSRFKELFTDWQPAEYWLADGRMFFDMSQFYAEEAEEEYPDDRTIAHPKQSFLDSSTFHGIATGALGVSSLSLLAKLAGII
jgi:hypothetical protein